MFTNSLVPSITNVIIVLDDSIANYFQCRGHETANIFSTFCHLIFGKAIFRISTEVFSLEFSCNCLNNGIIFVENTKHSDTTKTTLAVPFLFCLPEIIKNYSVDHDNYPSLRIWSFFYGGSNLDKI